MHLFLQMSKLQETTSYFDENAGRVGVKSDTVLPWVKSTPSLIFVSKVSAVKVLGKKVLSCNV